MPEVLTLADVCAAIVDCKNRTPPEVEGSGEFFGHAVGTPHIRDGRIDFSLTKRVSKTVFEAWTARAVPVAEDLILTREAPVGRVAKIPTGANVCLGQRTMLLRANPDRIHPRFLHYLLLSPTMQSAMHGMASGSTVPHLKVGEVRGLALPALPRLAEQRVIGELLGALDDKIAVNEKVGAAYEALLRLHFQRLGMDVGDSFSATRPITDLIDLNPTTRVDQHADAVFVDMAALSTSTARIQTWQRRPPKSGAKFVNGDTLLARITPCLENGKTGFVDFMERGEVGVGSTEFIVMRPRPGTPLHLPYFLARSPQFREFAVRHMVGSSGRQRVDAASIARYQVSLPAPEMLLEFDANSRLLFGHLKSLDSESKNLAKLRAALLPKLMSGEIRVLDAEKAVGDAV